MPILGGPMPGPWREGSSLCLRLSWRPAVHKAEPVSTTTLLIKAAALHVHPQAAMEHPVRVSS